LALGLFGGSVASAAAQGTDATPPGEDTTGSLAVSAFLSDQVSVPTITFASTNNAEDAGADYADANFELYINGDTAALPWATFNTAGGAVVVDAIPAGTHLLVLVTDEGPNYAWDVTITNASTAVVTVLIPTGELPGDSSTGSLVLTSYAAANVPSPEFFVSAPINVPPAPPEEFPASADDAYDIPYTGAYVVDREFLIFLNNDTSSVPLVLQTINGTALFDQLPSGTHTIMDAQTGYSDVFSIEAGFVTTVVAVFPEGAGDSGDWDGDPDTDAPDGDDDGSDDGDDDGSDDGDDGDDDGSSDGSSNGGGNVSKLPSTGQGGSTTDSSAIVMLLGAMSLVALAGGFAWRQRRSA
jgi:MYXO-CTERM domain-containing protein